MKLQKNEPLHKYTTLRTGGLARFFIQAQSTDEITEAVRFARKHQLPICVLGGGSNVLVSDAGFEGLVIRIASSGIRVESTSAKMVKVVAAAGESWDRLVALSVEGGLSGLENMSLIPGTVGGAVVGNIGAYGAELKDALVWAEALDLNTGGLRRFTARECQFRYRHSLFKTPAGRKFIITRAAFALASKHVANIAYKDLQAYFVGRGLVEPTLPQVREAIIAIRQRKLPDVYQVATAGSFFKNPVITRMEYESLAERYPGLPRHDEDDGQVKVPLAWILDRVCGLKGVRRGRVGFHPEQALVLVNDGGTAAEVEAFAHEVAAVVREKTGIEPQWEVEKIPGTIPSCLLHQQ